MTANGGFHQLPPTPFMNNHSILKLYKVWSIWDHQVHPGTIPATTLGMVPCGGSPRDLGQWSIDKYHSLMGHFRKPAPAVPSRALKGGRVDT